MTWLIGCEESGAVRDALLRIGIPAVSCDLKPSRSKTGEHLQCDLLEALRSRKWSGLMAFPDCTYLTCSAEWAYGDGPYHQRVKPDTLTGAARRAARSEAVSFFLALWNCGLEKVLLENPVGVIPRFAGLAASQTIQPYQFGDNASKRTCLWLRGLPKLQPTQYVEPRMVSGKPRWANQTDSGQNKLSPGRNRARDRSTTYPGIAAAIAEQLGPYGNVAATSIECEQGAFG